MIDILLIPIITMLVLVMIHSYFGLEILRRGIIFTDLAIAQSAALGSAISLGYFDGDFFYILTLGFALLSAALIATMSQKKINLEAFIGLLYVLSASSIMLVLSNSTEGLEHFKSLLANDILFTMPSDLIKSLLIYTVVAFILYFIYNRLNGFLKELLFFSLLAITVTSSVSLVGVFVVFVLLIAPPFSATTLKVKKPLLFSFYFGWTLSLLSIVLSYYLDMPTGYSIVFVLSLCTLLMIIVYNNIKTS